MSQIQTWNNCECFDNRGLCPHINEPLMKQHRNNVEIIGKYSMINDSKGGEVNKKYCNNCESFRPLID